MKTCPSRKSCGLKTVWTTSPGTVSRQRSLSRYVSGFPSSCARRLPDSNPVYYLLGETDAGRPLFCIVIEFPGNKAYPVTARDMTTKEKRRYAEWKGP